MDLHRGLGWLHVSLVVVLLACSRGTEKLPTLNINVEETSISGVSAGAYMASQIHVAHSKDIVGSGLVAGGPYGCAEGKRISVVPSKRQAFKYCLNGRGLPDPAALVQRANDLANAGEVDPLSDLRHDRVYLFSGGKDAIVTRPVVEAAKLFYTGAGVPQQNIAFITRSDAGHSFITTDTGNACGASKKPFVSDCDYDQAGAILKWIYGELKPPAANATGRFLVFDQSIFTDMDNLLAREGVVYIPEACALKKGCRLHIVLHGCQQNRHRIGMTLIEGSGFARWADTNRLVILFPQVEASNVNPNGCWDWWGYTGKKFLTKDAPQISAIWKMVEYLARAV